MEKEDLQLWIIGIREDLKFINDEIKVTLKSVKALEKKLKE